MEDIRNLEQELQTMRAIILDLVSKNDGKMSWYQMDRALIFRGIHPSLMGHMMPMLEQLEQGDLIRCVGEGPHPCYRITDAGRKIVEEQQEVAA